MELLTLFIIFEVMVFHATAQNIEPQENSTSIKKLQIDIYYESLCPDSVDFLTNQFAPSYSILKNFIDVSFVPFGKSESENGATFYCQHGPAECTGNRLQSCVIDALGNDQDAIVTFVTCQMKWNAEYTGQKCSNLVNANFSKIMTCLSGSKGVELQLAAEKKTHTIRKPYPRFVPTIVFEEKYNSLKQRRSLREFKRVVCDHLILATPESIEIRQACA